MSKKNTDKVVCPTCHTEYKPGSQQAKMVKDCGECHSCDHVRLEQYDDIPSDED